MKKNLSYGRFLLVGVTFLPLLMGCASLVFYDRNISMKESCVLVFQRTMSGNPNILFRGENTEKRRIDSWGNVKEIRGLSGKNTAIVPAGTFSLAYSNTLKNVLERRETGSYITEVYKMENHDATSEPFTFETGKRYQIEIPVTGHGATITITELKSGSISNSGVTTAIKSSLVASTLSWRYNNGFLFGEFGPQIGLSIVSDPMVMDITGEATIGIGIFGGENDGFGFPYRAGGSVTTFFGKSRFGFSLGGGVTGQTIMLLGDEDNDMFPKIQVPYIQVKGLFRIDEALYSAFGLYVEYYPTVTPVDFGAFGLGLAVNY